MIEAVEVKQQQDNKKTIESAKKPVKKLTNKQYWRQVGSNLSQNLGLIVYLVAIYLVVNCICGVVIEWQQAHWPVDKRYVLLYNQFLHLVVFSSFILALWAVPKFVLAKWRWSKGLNWDKTRLGVTGWLKWREIGLALTGFVLAFILRIVMIYYEIGRAACRERV